MKQVNCMCGKYDDEFSVTCSCRTQRRGMHDLKVWPGVEADGGKPTSTPGKSTTGEDQMSRLAKVLNDGESLINVIHSVP